MSIMSDMHIHECVEYRYEFARNLTMHLKNATKAGRREYCKSNCTHPNFCSVCENSSYVLGRWQPTPLLCIQHIFPASQSN